ncbi:MAG: C2H2-type zinc finger protein [Dehalogenimonas sp.]|uniref:C2H2-type zinc finger protein n=1 Tax=Candidatus Dehalogenimonas loeffleri TaxID=3127115 RepID=A0ABZ2J5N2_9CHLR|nr:C2H2-type zinc finger protein [Dehalogenimonas sp.]
MYTCKICGREFKSIKALGGHTSGAHPAKNIEPSNAEGDVPEQAEGEKDDESIAAEIREYLGKGYSFEQLTKQLHFKDRTVRQEIAKMTPAADTQPSSLPATYKQSEVISPEAVLRRYMGDSYEEQCELRGMMKLRASMLLVMELANIQKTEAEAEAKRFEPLLRVLNASREELDAAAVRARGASLEMAREAAQEAVGGVLGYIEEKLPKGPPPKTVDEAYAKRVDKVMDMMWGMMEQQMVPGRGGGKIPEGWETEQKKGGA